MADSSSFSSFSSSSSSSSSCLIHSHLDNSPAAWDWDLHNLALFNSSHISSLAAMESMITMTTTPPPYFSTTLGCDDSSSGYLEDVLLDYGNYSTKRRRLLYDEPRLLQQDSTDDMWPSFQSLINDTSHILTSNIGLSTCSSEESRSRIGSVEEISSMIFPETTQSLKEPSWALIQDGFDCSSSSVNKDIDMMSGAYNCDDDKFRLFSMTICQGTESEDRMKKKRRLKRLVYPFGLVKPGGEEGDVTLNDINERMLMPPTRPIRHPVGDFACRPCVSKPHGPGLSGKAVVALTRIRTLGRGTVTIIRTKG